MTKSEVTTQRRLPLLSCAYAPAPWRFLLFLVISLCQQEGARHVVQGVAPHRLGFESRPQTLLTYVTLS